MLPTLSAAGSHLDLRRPAPSGRAGRALDDEITTVGTLPDRGRLALGADCDLRVLYEAVPRLGDADRRRPGPTGWKGRSLDPTALDPGPTAIGRPACPDRRRVALGIHCHLWPIGPYSSRRVGDWLRPDPSG